MPAALRLHLVTLGVADVDRAARCYEALGLKRRLRKASGVEFFDAGGVVIAVFGRGDLAKDANVEHAEPGTGSFAIAHNVTSETAVQDTLRAEQSASLIRCSV